MDAGVISQYAIRTVDCRLTQNPACLTGAYSGMTQAPCRLLVQLNAPQSKLQQV